MPAQYHEHEYDDDSDIEDDSAEFLLGTEERSSPEVLDNASEYSSPDDNNVEKSSMKLRTNAIFAPYAAAKTQV